MRGRLVHVKQVAQRFESSRLAWRKLNLVIHTSMIEWKQRQKSRPHVPTAGNEYMASPDDGGMFEARPTRWQKVGTLP
jgi:hypothetical protein